VPVSGHAKGPLCGRALVTYSGLERDLGRLQLGRHGTSPQGFVLLAGDDVCVRLARVHDVKARIPNNRGMRSRRRRLDQCGFSVGFELGLVDDLLDQERDIGEPSLDADCNCGRELVQRLVPIGKRGCGCRVTAAALALLASLTRWTSICLKKAIPSRYSTSVELFSVHPTSDGGFLDTAALGRLVGRDKAGQLIVGLIKVTLPVGKLRLDL
jgi:hypothetical protein